MQINGRKIGPGESPYIVSEISCNHNGSLHEALALIDAAKWAGADAVKMQAYTPDTITIDCDNNDFIIKDGPWKGRKLYELYQKTHTPFEWIPKLFSHAESIGITLFASVFDETALEILERQNCPAYKIASMEITDIPLIRAVAKTGKPVIISTGMASFDEIKMAASSSGTQTAFLHCISGYPTPPEESNLFRIADLEVLTGCIAGVSDHTKGWEIMVAAAARGARIIEKHLKGWGGFQTEDTAFSSDPQEFKMMVDAVRRTWEACQPSKAKSEESSRQMRRSLYVIKDMKAGDRFTRDNVRSIRPAYGLPPKMLDDVLGKIATCDIERGTALAHEHFSSEEWHQMWKEPYYRRG